MLTRPAPVVYAGGNSAAETRSGLQFCSPLLREADYDIRTVHELLGHRDVKTTMIYTHVLNREGRGMQVLRIGY